MPTPTPTAVLAALPDLLVLLAPDGTVLDPRADEPARSPILPPDVATLLGTARERVARTGLSALEHYATVVDGEERSYEARLVPIEDGYVLGILRDVTDRMRAEDALAESRRRAEATLRASEAQLRLALENAAMGTWEWRVDEDRVAWSEYTGPLYGLPAGTPGITTEQFYALVHPDDRQRMREVSRRPAADGDLHAAQFRVVWPDGSIRWLERKGRAVAHDDTGRTTRILGVTMDITERKQAEESLHELSARLLAVEDEERRRLARELHEQTSQTLVALTLEVATARRKLGLRADPVVDRLLSDVETLGQQALNEVRTISYVLHPPMLDEAGLAAVLREYAAGFGLRSGVAVDLAAVDDILPLPKDAEVALLRIAQEAFSNVARHAGANRATLALSRGSDQVVLRVADNGRGMAGTSSIEGTARLGVGIAGMRERVRQLGGELEIASDAGGTVVTARLPLGGQSGDVRAGPRTDTA